MTVTRNLLKMRRGHIGASDTPGILGLSPWITPSRVYWSKVGPVADNGNASTATGNRMENAILDFASEELGAKLRRNQYRVSHGEDNGILSATFDALIDGKDQAVEAKYVSQHSAAEWGSPGTDEVPRYVLAQCQHQAYVGDLEGVWVAAAIADYSIRWQLYWIPRHERLIKAIVDRDVGFWQQHVLPQRPPNDEPPPMEILEAMDRTHEVVYLGDNALSLVEAYREAQKAKQLADDRLNEAKADLIRAIGDAEVGRMPDGSEIRYLQRTRRSVDTTRLKATYPDIATECVKETVYRQLNVTKPKGQSHEPTEREPIDGTGKDSAGDRYDAADATEYGSAQDGE